jgi:hypothetical protein
MDLHPDFSDLLAELARFGVRYALLGGYAVGYHGKPRMTKDLDLLRASPTRRCSSVFGVGNSTRTAPPEAATATAALGDHQSSGCFATYETRGRGSGLGSA